MRSTKEVRNFLVDQMEKVATGDVEPEKAKGVANLAQQIYNTLNIEIKMAQSRQKLGEDVAVIPVEF